MLEEKPSFKVPLKEYYQDLDWQSVGIGVFAGFILTLLLMWYIDKDKKPDDWCTYLDRTKSSLCFNLYDQATKKMQERSDYEEAQQGGIYPYGDPRMQ